MTTQTKIETFCSTYAEELAKARLSRPDRYAWPMSELDAVTARMTAAIRAGSFNKDSDAFRATCKRLGIAHTYKAINAYLTKATGTAS